MTEQQAIDELKAMSREELEKVPKTLCKCRCQVKGCNSGTKVWDFGISPQYFLPRKNSRWLNLQNTFWLCGKHYAWFKKLVNLYGHFPHLHEGD